MRRHSMTALVIAAMSLLMTHAAAARERWIGDGEAVDFALVIDGDQGKLYLSAKPSNEPLAKAKLTLKPDDGKDGVPFAETDKAGVYLGSTSGRNLVGAVLVVEVGDDTEAITLEASAEEASKPAAQVASHCDDDLRRSFGSFLLGTLVGIVVALIGAFIWRRQAARNAMTIVVLTGVGGALALSTSRAEAHEGHTHAPELASESTAGIGGIVSLAKESQFLLGVRTVLVKQGSLPEAFISYGHVIAKPQLDAVISSPQAGFLRGTESLMLGADVNKGQTLGYVEAVSRIPLTAPIAGKIYEVNTVDGTRVESGEKLIRVTDTSKLWIDGEVFASDLVKMKDVTGAFVNIEGRPEAVQARIVGARTAIGEETRTAKVFLELENPQGELGIGSFATVTFTLKASRDGLPVPSSALLSRGGDVVLFVQTGPETFALRQVVSKPSSRPGTVLVTRGVADGERVVVSGNYQLLMKVK